MAEEPNKSNGPQETPDEQKTSFMLRSYESFFGARIDSDYGKDTTSNLYSKQYHEPHYLTRGMSPFLICTAFFVGVVGRLATISRQLPGLLG
jgi:hypothetical protein